jgi:transposase
MWAIKNRARCDRSKLRYPSDLTDDEWALTEPLISPAKRGGLRRTVIMRQIVNGLMYVLSTGCQWHAIPKHLPPKSTIYEYFELWTYDRTLDRIIMRSMSNVANKSNEKPAQPPQSLIVRA